MNARKKDRKLEEGLKKAATSVGKTLARSQVKIEKTGRRAVKSAKKLVKGMTHSAEEVLARTAGKLRQAEGLIGGERERNSTRFRGIGHKSVAETIGLLAGEIRIYMEEHEEIGASKLLSVMKGRGYSDAVVFAAMGWLIKEKKIAISEDGKKVSQK
jgi:hypothetical protein